MEKVDKQVFFFFFFFLKVVFLSLFLLFSLSPPLFSLHLSLLVSNTKAEIRTKETEEHETGAEKRSRNSSGAEGGFLEYRVFFFAVSPPPPPSFSFFLSPPLSSLPLPLPLPLSLSIPLSPPISLSDHGTNIITKKNEKQHVKKGVRIKSWCCRLFLAFLTPSRSRGFPPSRSSRRDRGQRSAGAWERRRCARGGPGRR